MNQRRRPHKRINPSKNQGGAQNIREAAESGAPTPTPPVGITGGSAPHDEEGGRQRTHTKSVTDDAIVRLTRRLVFWTAGLVVSTLVTAAILFCTDRTLRDTIDANKISAENQLNAFESEARIRLRAYLTVIGSRTKFGVGEPLTFKATIQAGGQSPAFEVIGWIAMEVEPYPLPKDFKFPTRQNVRIDAEQHNKISLNPGNTVSLVVNNKPDNPVTQAIYDVIKVQKTSRVYAWGEVFYRDVFGCKRSVSYCFSADDSVDPANIDPCPQHNEAEGEPGACPK